MEALGIDITFLSAQLINFGLFTFIFVKFLYKPFKKYMADQHTAEQEKDRLLQELQVKEEKLAEKQKAVLAEARQEAQKILKAAEAQAEAKRKDILAKAQEDATALKQKAQKDMESEKEKMYDELRSKVVRTSETMTETVLKDFLSESQQKDILKNVFAKLESSKVYEN